MNLLKGRMIYISFFILSACKVSSSDDHDTYNTKAAIGSVNVASFGDNTRESRERLAAKLNSDFSALLSSNELSMQVTKAMVRSTILQLQKGSNACAEEDKITLFRGGNPFLLKAAPEANAAEFSGKSGNWFFLANAFLRTIPFDRVRASKTNGTWTYLNTPYEEQFLTSGKIKSIKYEPLSGLKSFANQSSDDSGPLENPLDYDRLSGRHTGSSEGSPLISLSSSFDVAASYGVPVISGRFCPGRVFPTHSQQWSTELEWLTFQAIFPEEIDAISGLTELALAREFFHQSSDPSAKETEAFEKLGNELRENNDKIIAKNPPGSIKGNIELSAKKCVDVPTVFEKGDKTHARVAISNAFKSYSRRALAEFTDLQNGAASSRNFLIETRKFFEERCDCKRLIRESNDEARSQGATFFWREDACDIPEDLR